MASPADNVATYFRLIDELGEALEAQTVGPEWFGKLDRLELLHGTIPLSERGGDRLEPQRITDMIASLRKRLQAQTSGAGKFKSIPITHDRQRCCDSDFYR